MARNYRRVSVFSNPFRSEEANSVNKSWDDVIGRIGNNEGTIIRFNGKSFHNTETLKRHGVRICEYCAMLQPIENITCCNCEELTIEEK